MVFKGLTIFPFLFRRLFSSATLEPVAARPSFSKNNSIHRKKIFEPSNNVNGICSPTHYSIARFSDIIVAGSGNGGLGCGHSKHDSASEAVAKAGKLAVRDIQHYNRWQSRTLFHDDFAKYKATKLYVRPAPPSKFSIISRHHNFTFRFRQKMSSDHCRNVPLPRD